MVELVLSRRSALCALGLVAAGGVVGYVAAGHAAAVPAGSFPSAANGYGPTADRRERRLAAADAIPRGGGVIVSGIVVTRDAGGVVHGFSATCTHQGCAVTSVADGVISCPCHGSRFDATTGAVVEGPATRPLPPVVVTVRGDDVLTGGQG